MATPPANDHAATKRLLVLSKREPVHCAIGLAKDGQTGLLMLDKLKQPRVLERDLLKADPNARNTRFGRAVVDTDEDAKLVKIYINKAVSGMARRLLKTLKGTGFSKLELLLDEDGSLVDSAMEEDAAVEPQAPAAPQAPIAEAVPPTADADALRHKLMEVSRRIADTAGGDAARRATLVKLAGEAAAHLKVGDLSTAQRVVDALAAALPVAAVQPTPAGGKPDAQLSPVKLGKAALLWRGMWTKADAELEALRAAVLAAVYEDEEIDPEEYAGVQAKLDTLHDITTRLNLSLADDLTELQNAEPAARAAPLAHVNTRLDQYEAFLEGDPLVGTLADNEYHPVALKADLLRAVDTIRSALVA